MQARRIWNCTVAMVLSLSAAAHAGPYAKKNLPVGPVFVQSVSLIAGKTYTFSTRADPGVDPVMHIYGGREEARSDDSALGKDAQILFTPKVSRMYQVIVHAQSVVSQGQGDVLLNGDILQARAFFGGNVVALPFNGSAKHAYETVLAPNGALDTVIYGLGCDGQIVAIDDDGGVGTASRIQSATRLCQVLVDSKRLPVSHVHFYVNDRGADLDGDGLGQALERELGTCDGRSSGLCQSVSNPRDTDGDGLSDAQEVFGIDDVDHPQHLAKWGADPLRQDAFVEVDFAGGWDAQPLTAEDAQDIQRLLSAQTGNVTNFDGTSGVRVHLDLGVEPKNPALSVLFGDWGGSGPRTLPVRERMFLRAVVVTAKGESQRGRRHFQWSVEAGSRNVEAFVLELARQLSEVRGKPKTKSVASAVQ